MIALISLLRPVPNARHALILQHIPYVRSYVRNRFRNLGKEERQDLFSAAMLGLVEAASRYDEHLASDFWAYAKIRVHGVVSDHLRSVDPLTRTQRSRVRQLSMCEDNDTCFLQNAHRDDETRRMRGCRVMPFSSLETEGEESFADRLADPNAPVPEEVAQHADALRMVMEWIDDLPQREQQVLHGIYRDRKSPRDVAKSLSLTEGRISQLHQQGLQMLRERWLSAVSR